MSTFLVGSGMMRLFVESDSCAAFFPSQPYQNKTVEDVLVVGNDLVSGPVGTLTKISTRQQLHQEFGNQTDSFAWLYFDEMLAFSIAGSPILYRTEKSVFHALHDIAAGDYPYANDLKQILKDLGV